MNGLRIIYWARLVIPISSSLAILLPVLFGMQYGMEDTKIRKITERKNNAVNMTKKGFLTPKKYDSTQCYHKQQSLE